MVVKFFKYHVSRRWDKHNLKRMILEENDRLKNQINLISHPTVLSISISMLHHNQTIPKRLYVHMNYSRNNFQKRQLDVEETLDKTLQNLNIHQVIVVCSRQNNLKDFLTKGKLHQAPRRKTRKKF